MPDSGKNAAGGFRLPRPVWQQGQFAGHEETRDWNDSERGLIGPQITPPARLLRSPQVGGMLSCMSDVTRILSAIEQGDPHAAEQLLPLVYDELRKLAAQRMAQESPGQTLQATDLVHEAYLRLVDVADA